MAEPASILATIERDLQAAPLRLAFGSMRSISPTSIDEVTLIDLVLSARRLAARLQTLARPGDRALLISRDVVEHVRSLLACWYAGLVGVSGIPPHPPRAHGTTRQSHRLARLRHVLTNSGASLVLADSQLVESFKAAATGIATATPIAWVATDVRDNGPPLADQTRGGTASDLAMIQYTSGSTSGAKGVMLTHGNLVHNLAAQVAAMALTPADIGVSWLPPHHDMGLIGTGLLPLFAGFPFYVMTPEQFAESPLRWLSAISDVKATISFGPNFAFGLCASKATPENLEHLDLSRWRCALNGSEPIQAVTVREFSTKFAVAGFSAMAMRPAFGLAEATLMVSSAQSSDLTIHRVSRQDLAQLSATPAKAAADDCVEIVACGRPLPGVDVQIVEPETGRRLPDGTVGEIWCGGESVAVGYWADPIESKHTFEARLPDGSGPYLRTGDLGFLWQGELHFAGRLKDLIVLRGANYYPQDIEAIVEESDPSFHRGGAAAFAIDEDGHQRLVLVAEIHRRSETQADYLIGRARRAVFDEMGLELGAVALVRRGAMTKTPSGKLQRRACQSAFLSDGLETVQSWRRTDDLVSGRFAAALGQLSTARSLLELKQTVRRAAGKLCDGPYIDDKIHFADLGISSIGLVELSAELRRTFGVVIKAAELHEMGSMDHFSDLLWDRLHGDAVRGAPEPETGVPSDNLHLLLKLAARTDNSAQAGVQTRQDFDLATLLPAEVGVFTCWEHLKTPAYPAELDAVANAVASRRAEFQTGRECARRAFAALGVTVGGLPRTPSGAVQWPPLFTGSITHTSRFFGAAVGYRSSVRSIGIDAEELSAMSLDFARKILTPDELMRLSELPAGDQILFLTIVFSAKESLFKAQFPLTGRWLDFADAEIRLHAGQLQIRCAKLTGSGLGGQPFRGRYALVEGHVVTAVTLS